MNNTSPKAYIILTRNILIHNLSEAGYNGQDIADIFKIDKSVVCRILDNDFYELTKQYNQIFNKFKGSIDYNK